MTEEIMLLEDAKALSRHRGRSQGLAGPILGSLGVFDNLLPDKREIQDALTIGAGAAGGVFLSERVLTALKKQFKLDIKIGSTTEMITMILISLVGAGIIAKAMPKQKKFAVAFAGGTIASVLLDIVSKAIAPANQSALTGSFNFPAIETTRIPQAFVPRNPGLRFPAVERLKTANGVIVG